MNITINGRLVTVQEIQGGRIDVEVDRQHIGYAPSIDEAIAKACQHNRMVEHSAPGLAWKCADCGYVYGQATS